MVVTTVHEIWSQYGFTMEHKNTFLQMRCDDTDLQQRRLSKTCPDECFLVNDKDGRAEASFAVSSCSAPQTPQEATHEEPLASGLVLTSLPKSSLLELSDCNEELTPCVQGDRQQVYDLSMQQDVLRAQAIAASCRGSGWLGGQGCAKLQRKKSEPEQGTSAFFHKPQRAVRVQTLAATGHGPRRNSGRGHSRLHCHIFLDPAMLEPGFDLVKKLIGRGGRNTKEIFEATQTKVRVRGTGSGHIEINGREAPVPLMVALAGERCSPEDFRTAFSMTETLLLDVSERFEGFLAHRERHSNKGPSKKKTASNERFWVGEASEETKSCLAPLLQVLQ
jgi:hypothetical protein